MTGVFPTMVFPLDLLKLLTNLEKYFMCLPRRRRLVAALLFFCKFEDDNYKFMQCILCRCLKYTKFGQLILQKIVKIVATSCQILRLKCTTFDFGWGSAPDLAGGAYSAPPNLLAGFKVAALQPCITDLRRILSITKVFG